MLLIRSGCQEREIGSRDELPGPRNWTVRLFFAELPRHWKLKMTFTLMILCVFLLQEKDFDHRARHFAMKGFRVVEHQVPASHIREYTYATANSEEDVLHISAKQYIPLDNPNPRPGDVTLICTHANAFPKELYEPLWEDLLPLISKHGWRIRSIWATDVAHQGHSSVLNEHLLGNEPAWHDHSRDLLHLINLKRDQMPRPIVGIGHSMGGNQL